VSSRGDARPRDRADLDIWIVDRDARGKWGEPGRMPEPVNSPGSELLPRPQIDGSLIFGSDRAGGLGGGDIYLARRDGGGWRIENLGAPVNTAANEYEAELSRDGRLLIVVADRGDRSHFYPYRRESGTWVPQARIVPTLGVFQVGPLLSPRADRLLFAQADGARSGELFVIDLAPGADREWPPSCSR
jgi:Tol biopolymer transport system component